MSRLFIRPALDPTRTIAIFQSAFADTYLKFTDFTFSSGGRLTGFFSQIWKTVGTAIERFSFVKDFKGSNFSLTK